MQALPFMPDQVWLVFVQLPSLDGSGPEVEQRVVVAPSGQEGALLCHALLSGYGTVIAVVSLPQLRQATAQSYVTSAAPGRTWPAWFSPGSPGHVVWLRGPKGLFAYKIRAGSSAEALLAARLAHPDCALVLAGAESDGLEALALLEGIAQDQSWSQVHYDLRSGCSRPVVQPQILSMSQQALEDATQGWSQDERIAWEHARLVGMGIDPDEI